MKSIAEKQTSYPADTVKTLARAFQTLYGGRPEGRTLQTRCMEAFEELEGFGGRREIIAIIGAKNTGKSWLCRQLVKSPADAARIKSGLLSRDGTSGPIWVGPGAPVQASGSETSIHIPADRMADLGRDYTLLDLPGYDDIDGGDRNAALRVARSAAFRIFMVSSERIEIESQLAYLNASDGTCILPIIVDAQFPQLLDEGGPDVETLLSRLRAACPDARIAPPLIVPRLGEAAAENMHAPEDLRRKIQETTRTFIHSGEIGRNVRQEVVLQRLRNDLARPLEDFIIRVGRAHAELLEKEDRAAGNLIRELLGSDRQLEAGTRSRLRMEAFSRCSSLWFPFRPLLGVLSMTSGAWDRLPLVFAGSVPSLATVAFQTMKNTRSVRKTGENVKDALAKRARAVAVEELRGQNIIFTRALHAGLGLEEPESNKDPEVDLPGFETLTAKSGEKFSEAIRTCALSERAVNAAGVLSSLIFLALAAGPLKAVYAQFLLPWWQSLSTNAAVGWQDFPTPSFAMILGTFVLISLPAMIIAMFLAASAGNDKRTLAAVKAIRVGHGQLHILATKGNLIRLQSKDPVRGAAREILTFLGDGKPRRD